MNKLRMAIVGCGAITEKYYGPALQEIGHRIGLEVTDLLDVDLARAREIGSRFPGASVTSSLSDIVARKPDLAVVASPPRFHAQQTIELLQAGTPVLCEKPMASTVDEALRMSQVAEQANVPLAIGLYRRFFPANQEIHHVVKHQSLGKVKSFRISEGGRFQWPAKSASFFQKSANQGGVLFDLGIHVLDLLIWWFGFPSAVTYEDDAMGGLEANCLAKLRFTDGIHGSVLLSRDCRVANWVSIECEHGWLRTPSAASSKLEIKFRGSDRVQVGNLEELDGLAVSDFYRQPHCISSPQAFGQQLINFVSAVRGKGAVAVPGTDGILSLKLVEQCYQNRRLMKLPWLSEAEQARARELSCGSPS